MSSGATISSEQGIIPNWPLDEIPTKYRDLAARAIEAHEAHDRADLASRKAKVESIISDAKSKLQDLVGPKRLAKLHQAMAEERRLFAALREPPGGLTTDWEAAAKKRQKRMEAVLSNLQIDPKGVVRLRSKTRQALWAVLNEPGGPVTAGFNLIRNLDTWTELTPNHRLPLDWGVRPPIGPLINPSDFTIFGPSFTSGFVFPGSTFGYGGFRVRRDFTMSADIGLVGNQIWIDDDNPDFEVAQAIQDADLIFVYQAPASGRVEVIIDAMSLVSQNDLSIRANFAFATGHSTGHNNYLTFMVYHPNTPTRALAQMAQFAITGTNDQTWSEQALTSGAHYYAVLTTDGAVEAGDTFFASVGTRSMDLSFVHNVNVHSFSNFEWLIRTAEVRIVT